jgi:hypothetical protein
LWLKYKFVRRVGFFGTGTFLLLLTHEFKSAFPKRDRTGLEGRKYQIGVTLGDDAKLAAACSQATIRTSSLPLPDS